MALELLVTDEAVCLNKAPGEAGAKVVPCDSPDAAYQLVGKGAAISAEEASRYKVKTKKAETAYTLRVDSHTIARTPEEKAYAATQPQPGLVAAQAEHIRSAALLSIESLHRADQQKLADAQGEADKSDAAADKKVKASLAAPRKPAKASKKAKASRPKAERKSRKSKPKAEATAAPLEG